MFAESLIALVGLLSVQAGKTTSPSFDVTSLPLARTIASVNQPPMKKDSESFGVDITAKAGAILDVKSGAFLFEKDANTAYPIASLTKLLTVMTFLDTHPNFSEEVTIAPEDEASEGEMVFPANEKLNKKELMRAVMIGSVNAGANTLARLGMGDKDLFIRQMNEKARSLGMRHALFFEPTGLDPRNQASAKDIAIALRAALEYPEIREATQLDHIDLKGQVTGKMYHVKSTNLLLGSFLNQKPYQIIAGKTGSLPEAGFCLAQATRNQGGNEVIAVVLGSENHFARFQDTKALTAWAFDTFEWR